MAYSSIDGDVSDFIDAREEVDEYFTADLRAFLMNEGHERAEVDEAIRVWQGERMEQLDPSWVRFRLTPEGRAIVRQLRARNLHP